jgi:hypothetical protein
MVARAREQVNIQTSWFVLTLLVILVAGYWAFGKAFAYIGLYPLYIGEVVMVVGLLALVRFGTIPIPRNPHFFVFLLLFAMCLAQAVFSFLILDQPLLEVFRGLAMIYYGAYAYITFVLIERAREPGTVLERALTEVLPRIAPWVLIGSTLSIAGFVYFLHLLPFFPRTDVPILWYKPTDAVMPLVVMLVAWMRGYLKTKYAIWAAGLILFAAARSRSAMLGVSLAFLIMMWRPTKRMVIAIVAALLIFAILLITDVSISMGYREISARQFMANAISLVSSEGASDLDATTAENKSWRLSWWTAIINDAATNLRFLVGTGWGDNLANRYGFQIFDETEGVNVLRNPHNAFINVLGKGGWIVATLWLLLHVMVFASLWKVARDPLRSVVERDITWICLVYLTVSLMNGSTDVFLESPQNAIPHWIIIGVSWSLVRRGRESSEELRPQQALPAGTPAARLARRSGAGLQPHSGD